MQKRRPEVMEQTLIDKKRAIVFLRAAEKILLTLGKKCRCKEIVNVVREKSYYSRIYHNPSKRPVEGLTTYVGLLKGIPAPHEPTVALMMKGKSNSLDLDFYKHPLEVYYIVDENIKEIFDDGKIKLSRNGFTYSRPRIGPPQTKLSAQRIDDICNIVLHDLHRCIKRRYPD